MASITGDEHGDNQVRATGSDAALSKTSASTKGYVPDPFIHLFVKPSRRTIRRAPLINRGYYARTRSIHQLVLTFLQHCTASTSFTNTGTGTAAQIITLGAGCDTLFFRLCAEHPKLAQHLVVFETDFQNVIDKKQQICNAHETLRDLAARDQYRIFPCDLRDLNTLTTGLESAGFDSNIPTLLLSECVLIYMESQYSNRVIEWAGNNIRSSVFVTYEQIKPSDAFGAMMVRNIKQRGCPLKSIHDYPTCQSLVERYQSLGYGHVQVRDMNDVYYNFIDDADRARAEKLELFDELEEWHLIQGHYCLAVAVNEIENENNQPLLHTCLDFFE